MSGGLSVRSRIALDHVELDYSEKVITLTAMDIEPTFFLYVNVDRRFAEACWFWSLLTAPNRVPETLIASNPKFFMTSSFFTRRYVVEDAAFDNLLCTMSRPGAVHPQSENYRAAYDPSRSPLGELLAGSSW